MVRIRAIAGEFVLVVGVLCAIIAGIWGGAAVPASDGANWILLTAAVLIGVMYVTAPIRAGVVSAAAALTVLAIWAIVGGPEPVGNASQPMADNVLGFVYCFGLLMAPAAIIVAIRSAVSVLRWEAGLAYGRQPSRQAGPAKIGAAR